MNLLKKIAAFIKRIFKSKKQEIEVYDDSFEFNRIVNDQIASINYGTQNQ